MLRFGVVDRQLQPQRLGANGNGLIGYRRHVLALAEHVHHVDWSLAGFFQALGSGLQIGVGRFTQHLLAFLCQPRVHRNDAVAACLQVVRHFVAGTLRVVGHADNGHRAGCFEDVGDIVHGTVSWQ